MQLDGARELKAALAGDRLASPTLVVSRDLGDELPAQPLREAARLRPGIALGIAPTAAAGDFRLAVRVQRRDLLDGPHLERIRSEARGEVDVAYVGAVTKRQAPATRERERPLRIGWSVAHRDVTAGTIGGLLPAPDGDGWLLLSNNHVLAEENRARLGDEVLQPGPADGGRRPADVIGVLERFVPLARGGVNLVDAALAAVDEQIEVEPDEIAGLGTLGGVAEPTAVVEVAKLGRTTDLTRGTVTAFEVDDVAVGYDVGLLRFGDQIEITGSDGPFSSGGDSGSLIVSSESQAAVGLLFAGSDQGGPDGAGVTFANPIAAVYDRLGALEPRTDG